MSNMKHIKLFEEFSNSKYRLDQAIPGKKLALGSIGEPVKDIEELEPDEIYWFPSPSGNGYDVPMLGILGTTGGNYNSVNDTEEYNESSEFYTYEEPEPEYSDIINYLARMSGCADEDGNYMGHEGLGTDPETNFAISYDEMKKLISERKVLRFKEDTSFRGFKPGQKFGI